MPGLDGEKGRELLRYLVSCALPAHSSIDVTGGGNPVERMPGSLGLAPAWLERGLTETEKHWVSACIYARTNFFGIPVLLSLRGNHPHADALAVDDSERERMSLHEGGFFGNFFAPGRPAYVCTPDVPPPENANVMRYRVCTLPAARDAEGRSISACGFVIRGACSVPATFETGEGRYDAVIHAYLDPDFEPDPASMH